MSRFRKRNLRDSRHFQICHNSNATRPDKVRNDSQYWRMVNVGRPLELYGMEYAES
jgi:hypothetical protein